MKTKLKHDSNKNQWRIESQDGELMAIIPYSGCKYEKDPITATENKSEALNIAKKINRFLSEKDQEIEYEISSKWFVNRQKSNIKKAKEGLMKGFAEAQKKREDIQKATRLAKLKEENEDLKNRCVALQNENKEIHNKIIKTIDDYIRMEDEDIENHDCSEIRKMCQNKKNGLYMAKQIVNDIFEPKNQ